MQPRSQARFLHAKTRRKDPGRSWSRATQILGGKLQLILGRGGGGARVSCLKMLRLKLMNLCVSALCLRFCIVFYRLTIRMASSTSSIELHVSYLKRHSLTKSLHSRRCLRPAEEVSKYIWIESNLALLAKLFCWVSRT